MGASSAGLPPRGFGRITLYSEKARPGHGNAFNRLVRESAFEQCPRYFHSHNCHPPTLLLMQFTKVARRETWRMMFWGKLIPGAVNQGALPCGRQLGHPASRDAVFQRGRPRLARFHRRVHGRIYLLRRCWRRSRKFRSAQILVVGHRLGTGGQAECDVARPGDERKKDVALQPRRSVKLMRTHGR